MADAIDADGGERRAEGSALAGALLREARERSGRTLAECATALRARPGQLDALEQGDLSGFGGDIYARGFLRSYARLLDVEPERVLELHGQDPAFGGPVLPPREPLRLRRDPPGWLVGLVGLAAVVGVVVAVLGLGASRVPSAVAPSDPSLDAPSDGALPPAEDPAPAPPEPEPEPEPVPAGPPVDVVLTFEAASWLEVLVDGVAVEPGALVAAGETLRFSGQELVSLRFGNAGGVRIEINGEELGAAGRPGEVLRVGFGPDGPVDGALGTAAD